MDIFTHTLIGAAATAPFWSTHPLESVAFVLGSVLPDIDALSRQFGKVAYLRAHQTWTHAIPVQLAATVLGVVVLTVTDLALFIPSVVALGAGMALHSLLDWTNTYGVKLFAPFDVRRRYLEWVFFIDGPIVALTVVGLAIQGWLFATQASTSLVVAGTWAAGVAGYLFLKAGLRRRAGRMMPGAVSLVPSAMFPWRFYGLSIQSSSASTFRCHALTGQIEEEEDFDIHAPVVLERLAEFRVMRELSVGFLATSVSSETIVCRDLRTRNFGTNFGRLTIDVSGPHPVVEQFDV